MISDGSDRASSITEFDAVLSEGYEKLINAKIQLVQQEGQPKSPYKQNGALTAAGSTRSSKVGLKPTVKKVAKNGKSFQKQQDGSPFMAGN